MEREGEEEREQAEGWREGTEGAEGKEGGSLSSPPHPSAPPPSGPSTLPGPTPNLWGTIVPFMFAFISFFFGATVRPILVAKFGLANAKMCHNRSCRNVLLAKVGRGQKENRRSQKYTAPHRTRTHTRNVFSRLVRGRTAFFVSVISATVNLAPHVARPATNFMFRTPRPEK